MDELLDTVVKAGIPWREQTEVVKQQVTATVSTSPDSARFALYVHTDVYPVQAKQKCDFLLQRYENAWPVEAQVRTKLSIRSQAARKSGDAAVHFLDPKVSFSGSDPSIVGIADVVIRWHGRPRRLRRSNRLSSKA